MQRKVNGAAGAAEAETVATLSGTASTGPLHTTQEALQHTPSTVELQLPMASTTALLASDFVAPTLPHHLVNTVRPPLTDTGECSHSVVWL